MISGAFNFLILLKKKLNLNLSDITIIFFKKFKMHCIMKISSVHNVCKLQTQPTPKFGR